MARSFPAAARVLAIRVRLCSAKRKVAVKELAPDMRIMIPPMKIHNERLYNDLESPAKVSCTESYHEAPKADPDLSRVVSAWPNLPDGIKAGILAMIDATR